MPFLFILTLRIYIYYKQLFLIYALFLCVFLALSMRYLKAKALILRASELHLQSTVDMLS